MATILRTGETINGFRITKAIVPPGQFCNSYFATETSSGTDVFLKQYTEPTKKGSSWYAGFLRLQDSVQRRLRAIPMPELVEKTIKDFEEGSIYFQVKELVIGKDLDQLMEINSKTLEGMAPDEEAFQFQEKQWYVNAALMMEAIKQIHAAGVIHTDLKPANIYMAAVPYKVKFRAKVIDFDFCQIDGEKCPYAVKDGPGTVGTLGYMSPEHIQGIKPVLASDIFTCGIMLYELLCGTSPFYELYDSLGETGPDELNSAILEAVKNKAIPTPESINSDLAGSGLAKTMMQMLELQHKARPTAEQVHRQILSHIGALGNSLAKRVNLRTNDGRYKSITSDTVITHQNARIFGPGYKFVDQQQFRVFKDLTDGKWKARGLEPVTNNTRLNGEIITGNTVDIEDGDVISVAELELAVDLVI